MKAVGFYMNQVDLHINKCL